MFRLNRSRSCRQSALLGGAWMVLLLAAGAGMPAAAASIVVTNPSFEVDLLTDGADKVGVWGWLGNGGVFNPRTGLGPGTSFSGAVPDGVNVGWLNGDAGDLQQTLMATLTANTTYTLQVDIGARKDSPKPFPGYSVSLLAGSSVLASESSLHPVDGFLTSALTFTALAGDTHLGQALGIRLHSNGIQTDFDNVRLSAVSSVPEPESVAMLLAGLAALSLKVGRSRSRTPA